jgi:HAMP domain-containing protein
MDLGVLNILNWRDVLLILVMLLAAYMLFMYLRMRRLHGDAVPSPLEARTAIDAYSSSDEPETGPAVRREPEFPWNEPPPEYPGQQAIERLEKDVRTLRNELNRLRSELAGMRDEMRQEISQGRAIQHVSPIYGEAMQMAMQGYDAETISEHCGVARAEAELVVAMVRSR